MTKHFFIIPLILMFQVLHGQNNLQYEFPQIVVPEVYSFIKYGEISTNESTGLANISIPIYTIKQDGITFPINLTYFSKGIRVTEEANWVGLGWDIKTGSITQIVQGYNDLETPVFQPDYHSSALITPMSESYSETGSQPLSDPYYGFISFWDERYPKNGNYMNWENRLFSNYPISDLEPDIFIANFNGYYIQFLIDPNDTSNYVILNKRGFKVNKTQDGWVVNTPEGTMYYFEEVNESHIYSATIGPVSYSEAFPNKDFSSNIFEGAYPNNYKSNVWKLSKIRTIVGRDITFHYSEKTNISNQTMSYQWDISKRTSFSDETIGQGYVSYGPIDFLKGVFPSASGPSDRITCHRSKTVTETSYLTSIQFNDGFNEIVFENSTREDIVNGKKLQSIAIKSGKSNQKTFVFNYDYFVSKYEGCGYISFKTEKELTHRLKLVSFGELGKPPYRFTYNNILLPPKNSFAQDYWGYYNGRLTNNSILPNIKRLMASPNISLHMPDYYSHIIDQNNTNNSADPNFAKASILNEIIYPTGGKTTFDYELNTYSNQILPDIDYKEVVHFSKQIEVLITNLSSNIELTREGFSIPGSDPIICSGKVSLTSYTTCNLDSIYARIYSLDISVKNEYEKNNNVFWEKFSSGNYSKQLVFERKLQLSNNNTHVEPINEDFRLNISPNNFYVAIVNSDNSCSGYPSNSSRIQINIEVDYQPNLNQSETQGNGLRIKSITNYINDKQVNKKQYFYSNGIIPLPRVFFKKLSLSDYISTSLYTLFSYTLDVFQFQVSNFIIYNPLGAGNKVYYGSVVIKNTDTNYRDIGHIEKHFTTICDDFLLSSPLTYMWGINLPSYRKSIDNGLLTKEEYFDSSNKLQKTIEYFYIKKRYNEFYGARYKFLGLYKSPFSYDPITGGIHSKGMFSFYPIFKTETLLTKRITKTNYSEKEISVEELIDYNDDNLIISKQYNTSKGSEKEFIYYYPDDVDFIEELTDTEKSYIKLLNKDNTHRINEVIKITESIKGADTVNISVIKETISRYNNWNGIILPAVIKTRFGKWYDMEVVFDKYDSIGNLLQYHKKDDIIISYYWGYHNTYPIAKLEGIAYNDIPTEVISELNKLDDDISKEVLKQVNKAIREKLPDNCFITTYTYKPLIGLLTQTDPNGITTYFEYDSFGRLEFIKDDQNNILKKYEYKYKNN